MKINKKAFTLVELLVVVLIIGILAAIALPQYQLATAKSRYSTLKMFTRSLAEAGDRYFLANNKHPIKYSDLDVSFPLVVNNIYETNSVLRFKNGITCNILGDGYSDADIELTIIGCWRYIGTNNQIMSYYHPYADDKEGKRSCWAYSQNENDVINKVCQAETGKQHADEQYATAANIYYY